MTMYALDHYWFTYANALFTAARIRHHPSRSSESHRNPRLCPSRWSPRQPTHRSPRSVMVWSSRSTVYRRGKPSSGFRQWPRIRYAFTLIVSPSCPTLIVPVLAQCGVGAGMAQGISMGQMLILSGRECRVNPWTLVRCRLDTIACGCSYTWACYYRLFTSFLYLGVCMMMLKGLRIDS